jgi:predicted nucleic acid-binding protein
MRRAFLDAGYVIAVAAEDDQHHAAAVKHWNSTLSKGSLRLVTTSFVFDEIVTFLNSKRLHAKAVEVGNSLLGSPTVQFVDVDRALFDAGWSLLQQNADKTYSLTDCISFVLMRQLGIRNAYTFDRHFRQAGFEMEP